MLTFVEVRHWSFSLLCILFFCILLVSIISLYMVPCIELVDIVLLVQIPRAELKRVAPLQIILRVMREVRWQLHWGSSHS